MLIGELAKATGLSKDTIRFYEKVGLLESRGKQAGSRIYREYGHDTVERLSLISHGKALGFTLSEMKLLIDQLQQGVLSKQDKVRMIERKIEEIAAKMQKLHRVKTYLLDKLEELDRQA
ncbi:MAG TPA: MerR family transcriptional regulator [Nodosilinea sp.]|nr:MerR family transcriptional regulator [Nodosilinea sp.]